MVKFKKISTVFLLFFSCSSLANICFAKNDPGVAAFVSSQSVKIYTMYACNLRPYTKTFMDVAVTEQTARQKVGLRCRMSEDDNHRICNPAKAECTKVEVKVNQ